MAWWLVAFAGMLGGLGLLAVARRRARALEPIVEAVPSRTIAELETGRFKLVGRVAPIEVSPSAIDGAPCVFREQAEYRTVGRSLVPLMREVGHQITAHPFWLDDGTGRILVDTVGISIEAVTLFEDDGMLAERRLRAGEEVEMVASFEPCSAENDGGPYRVSSLSFRPVADDFGPPRLSYRTQPGMLRPLDEGIAFLRGAGLVLMLCSAAFGAFASFTDSPPIQKNVPYGKYYSY